MIKSIIFSVLFSSIVSSAFAAPFYLAPVPNEDPKARINSQSLELNEQAVKAVQQRQFTQAENLFRRALQADDHNLTAVFNLAGMYLTNNKPKEAVTLLSQYVARYSHDAGLYVRLGDAYFASKEVDKALTNYEQAQKIAPTYLGINSKLGTIYMLKNRTADAETAYLRAIEQNPNDITTLTNLANLFLAVGKTDQAISTAKRAIQIKPSKHLYATLGNAYEVKQQFSDALIAYERSRDLGNTSKEVAEKITNLKRITAAAKAEQT
jgi:tetratricopeptide (TPR) repeat protein